MERAMGFEPTTPTLARLCCANCGSAFNSNYMIARRVRPQRRTRAACGDPDLFFSACASASRAEDQAPRRVDGRRLSRAIFRLRSQGHATRRSVRSSQSMGGCDWKKISCHHRLTRQANRPPEGRAGTQPFRQLRPTPPARDVAYRDGDWPSSAQPERPAACRG